MNFDQNIFDDEILFFQEEKNTQEAIFQELNSALLGKHIVTSDFLDAVVKREVEYPTGLNLGDGLGVAIPHTDADKVLKNQIAFMSLKHPVSFRQMGSDEDTVPVTMIFILCLTDAHAQLDMLQKLMTMFGDLDVMKQLQQVTNRDDFFQTISK